MAALVADTHTAIWYLFRSKDLSPHALGILREALRAGDPVYVASISLVEVTYLIEKGRLPDSALARLTQGLSDARSGFVLAPLGMGVAQAVRRLPYI